jgi:hypothetical protein
MTTVAQLVDSTYRRYLEPPDYQPPMGFLSTGITAGDLALTLESFALPEDRQLLRAGVLLEIDYELIRVLAYDDTNGQATVRRGELDTIPAEHAALAPTKISPPYPRVDVFDAVATNTATLSPSLFSVRSVLVSPTSAGVAPFPDDLATSIIKVTRENRDQIPVASFALVDYHPQVGGRAVLFPPYVDDMLWFEYRRRVGHPISEAATLEEIGLDPLWIPAVLAGAAGEMMIGRDVSRATQEWVSQSLEAEGINFGQRQQIGFGLLQYRQVKIEEFKREQTQQHKSITFRRTSPWKTSEGSIL